MISLRASSLGVGGRRGKESLLARYEIMGGPEVRNHHVTDG